MWKLEGLSRAQLAALVGPECRGKTTLALVVLEEARKRNLPIRCGPSLDLECPADLEYWARELGLDLEDRTLTLP